ncbi:hypothetical protein MAHJHV51_52190 [Mycobacterium avium subsp. hominissuis]
MGSTVSTSALPRGGADVETVLPKVRPIVQAVAERGVGAALGHRLHDGSHLGQHRLHVGAAALEFGASFDGVRPAAWAGTTFITTLDG